MEAFAWEKKMNENIRVLLKPGEEKEISQGFPWVYDNEIALVKFPSKEGIKTVPFAECSAEDGAVVEVFASSGRFLGSGVINRKSKITVRMIGSIHADQILADTKNFWSKRVHDAVNIRRLFFSETDSCRLVFGEADFIPGLIAEKYVSQGKVYLVVQFLALACEVFRADILGALKNAVSPDFIYERSDADVRTKEGLEQTSGWLGRSGSEVIQIEENGVKLLVDIAHGQKTGFFLDQKHNRSIIRRFCRGKKVLDAFSHTGAFGLNAAAEGARQVVCADSSQEAVDMAGKNSALNGVSDRVSAVCADVFALLKQYEADGEKFDVIILDPPAFTKKAKAIEKAYGGYKEINLRAMRLLNEGGILVTCSCSQYFDENTFYSMIMHAACDSHRRVQVLQKLGAAPDHPVLLGYPKSSYLKCAVCRVL